MFLLPTGNFIEGFMLDGKPSFGRNFNSRYLMVYPQPLNTLNEGFTFSIYDKAANIISQKRYCASGWNK